MRRQVPVRADRSMRRHQASRITSQALTASSLLSPRPPAPAATNTGLSAELSRIKDQGGACGAAGPASAPGLSLSRGPPGRTPGHACQAQIEMAHRASSRRAVQGRLPRHTIVQLAAIASRAALRSRRMRSATPTLDRHPLTWRSAPIKEPGMDQDTVRGSAPGTPLAGGHQADADSG